MSLAALFTHALPQDALDVALKMALSIPLTDILAYRKVAKAYFMLLDVLCHNHAAVIAARDTATFAFVLTSLDAGLKSLDVAVSSQCATALDNLAGFFFKNMQNNGEAPSPSAQVVVARCHAPCTQNIPTLCCCMAPC